MSQLTAELAAWPPAPELAAAWRELAVARENPFVTPDWTEASVAALGEEPRVIVCRDAGGQVRGVLPLVAGRRGRAELLRFPGGDVGDAFQPACGRGDEAAVAAACAALLAGLDGWQALELDRLLDGEEFVAALAAAWPGRGKLRPIRAERVDVLPYIDLSDGGVEGWLATRSRKHREDLRRRSRRLKDAGAQIRVTADAAALETDFGVLERLHDARWGEESEAFGAATRLHRRFAEAALRQGWLRFSIMELDGKPVAVTYAWRLGDRYMGYISGHDPEYRRQGVGGILMFETVRAASEEGVAVYDMMRGDEGYKKRLESGRREAPSFLICRPGTLRGLSLQLSARGKEAGRRLPEGPRTRLRTLYRGLRRNGRANADH